MLENAMCTGRVPALLAYPKNPAGAEVKLLNMNLALFHDVPLLYRKGLDRVK